MRKFIFLILLIFPSLTFGQSYEGSYRAVFFNFFSEPKMIVAEFEVRADNSLSGKIKIDESVKTFSAVIDKKGKFEALIEQAENTTYKLKGKFDQDNKISLIQRNQVGSGLNKSVSENGIEGKFSKIAAAINPTNQIPPQVGLIDTGENRLQVVHSKPLYGTIWKDFTATINFGNFRTTPAGSESKRVRGTADASDYFVLLVQSKIENQQTLRINAPLYLDGKKIWQQNELRVISYREGSGEQRNSFLASGETLSDDSRYAAGKIEIVNETETQIVFKLTNFRIKRIAADDFVTLSGFVHADQ